MYSDSNYKDETVSQQPCIYCGNSYADNYMNPGYFTLAVTDLKPQQMPMFLHISAKVWGRRWSHHTSEQRGWMLKPQ